MAAQALIDGFTASSTIRIDDNCDDGQQQNAASQPSASIPTRYVSFSFTLGFLWLFLVVLFSFLFFFLLLCLHCLSGVSFFYFFIS